ncbi:MAG TPA: VOC family protein [Steroidobacteraceae bacterium]|nr:VOC family protein [Steroidobacteraceae bacterium]
MSHRSRLAGFIIDSQQGSLAEAADFWGQALGLKVRDYDEEGLGLYAVLDGAPGALHVEVQKVQHPSRVHLDIETDDIEAEVLRLEKLGARRVEWVRNSWWVMEAPTGHRFCVVRMNQPEKGEAPTVWT